MTNEITQQEQLCERLCKGASARLFECFDTFQILAIFGSQDDDEDFPRCFEDGVGNILTRCRIAGIWCDKSIGYSNDVIDEAVDQLMKQFNAVTVVATNRNDEQRKIYVGGNGDLYARQQQALIFSNSANVSVDLQFEEDDFEDVD